MKRQRKIFIVLVVGFIVLTLFAFRVIPDVHAEIPAVESAAESLQLLENETYFEALLETFEQAREEIVLALYLFKTNGYRTSYPDRIVASLSDAAARGVSVRVLLETTGDRDSFIEQSNRETADRLRRGGVTVEFDRTSVRTHVKVVVVDRLITFLGSHNMTNSGLKYNNEASIMVISPEIAKTTLDYIDGIERGQ